MNGKITHYHIFVLSQQFGKTQTGQSGLNHRVWYLLCFFPMDGSFVPPCLKINGLEMGAIPGPHTQMKNGPLEFLRKMCTKSWLISAVFFIYKQFHFSFLPQSWSLTLLAALNMWSSFLNKRHTVTLLLGQSHTVFSNKSGDGFEILFIQQDYLKTMTPTKFVFCLTCLFLGEMGEFTVLKLQSEYISMLLRVYKMYLLCLLFYFSSGEQPGVLLIWSSRKTFHIS